MTAKSKTPEIRFKGFTDPWEQRKFEEVFTERREKTEKELEDVLLSCAISGMYLNSELFGHFRGTTTIGYLKVKKNDLILSAQNLHLGNVNVNLRFDHGIISPAYKVYDLNDCLPEFVQAWVKKESTKKFFLDATTEGASQCRKNIEWDTLGKQTISMPVKNEQKLIGRYFSRLDSLITLHQRKHEKLVQMKKAMLDKMFPKPGEKFPEIRFKGFTDPWEQRKFEEVFTERREKTEKELEDVLLSCAISGMYLNSELFGHFRGTTTIGYLKVKKNDLILSAQNLHLGNVNVNLRFDHGIISPAYKVYDLNDCLPEFVQAWVKKESTKKFFLDATTEGASQCRKNIEWDTLGKQTISMPVKNEQKLIGRYFSRLDSLITLHQRKLELLKNIKKAMLEKMFV